MRIQIQTTPGGHQSIHDEFEPRPKGFKSQIFEEVLPRLLGHYPTKSSADLRIEDLQSENDAALEKIEALSRALVDLGYDPTQIP
jgi:hypothetical protein